jgi:hypothetical protein
MPPPGKPDKGVRLNNKKGQGFLLTLTPLFFIALAA